MPIASKVLVVDDNKEITDILSRYFLEYKDEFTSISTNDPKNALKLMRQHEDIRLVISDFKMGAISGLDLLINVKKEFPSVQFIIMTAYGIQELREKAIDHGAVQFLEKPFQIHELVETIRKTLSRTESTSGFMGLIDSLQLADIIQFLGVSGGDAELVVKAEQGSGSVFFKNGNIVHAVCGEITGVDAFYEIFLWQGGNFVVSDLDIEIQIPQTITHSWQGLLLNAARMDDEMKAEAAQKAESPHNDSDPSDFIEDDADALAAFGIGESYDEVQAEPILEAITTPDNVYALGYKDIENALDTCIDHYMQYYPDSEVVVPVNKLSLGKLSPVLRRHLIFHFHHVSTSVIRTDDVPFDFTSPKVAKAAIALLEACLESWTISADDFRSMIGEAISFQIARSIYPAITVAGLIDNHAEGNINKTKSVLSSLLIKKVIENDYAPLLSYLDKYEETTITPEEIVKFLDTTWSRRSVKDKFTMMSEGIKRIFEIFMLGDEDTAMAMQQEILVTMLEAGSMDEIAEHIKLQVPDSTTPITLDDFGLLVEQFIE